MNANTMELTMDELELVNGGINLIKIFKEAAWGVGIGALVGGATFTVAAVLDNTETKVLR